MAFLEPDRLALDVFRSFEADTEIWAGPDRVAGCGDNLDPELGVFGEIPALLTKMPILQFTTPFVTHPAGGLIVTSLHYTEDVLRKLSVAFRTAEVQRHGGSVPVDHTKLDVSLDLFAYTDAGSMVTGYIMIRFSDTASFTVVKKGPGGMFWKMVCSDQQ